MSSSEEYLEKLLQSMMNGEVATPPNDEGNESNSISAFEMLTGEEPEQVMIEEPVSADNAVDEGMDDTLGDLVLEDMSLDDSMSADDILGGLDLGNMVLDDIMSDEGSGDADLGDISLDGMMLGEESGGSDLGDISLDGMMSEEAVGDSVLGDK